MKEITIIEEIKKEIPPLTDEELTLLEASIRKDGVRDPLVLWTRENDSVLIDGHNRYSIAKRINADFKTVSKEFDDMIDVKIWIRKNQLGRRNLTDGWKAELALRNKDDLIEKGLKNKKKAAEMTNKKLYNSDTLLSETDKSGKKEMFEEETDKKPITETQNQTAPEMLKKEIAKETEPIQKHNTRKEIAKELGWGEGKVARAEYVKKNSPENWEKAKSGDYSISKAYEETKKEEGKVKNVHVSNNSGNNEWYTPSEFIEIARKAMGKIETDPASSKKANEIVKADIFYTIDDNGLEKEWNGNVWLNPPYAQPLITQFTEKFVEEFEKGNITQGMVLVNNATETNWFQNLAKKCKAIWFIKSRIKYFNESGNQTNSPLQGQCILYFGEKKDIFDEIVNGFVCEVK